MLSRHQRNFLLQQTGTDTGTTVGHDAESERPWDTPSKWDVAIKVLPSGFMGGRQTRGRRGGRRVRGRWDEGLQGSTALSKELV